MYVHARIYIFMVTHEKLGFKAIPTLELVQVPNQQEKHKEPDHMPA